MQTHQTSAQTVVNQLQNKLRDSGWQEILKTFMVSDDFLTIIQHLEILVKDDKRFTPRLKQVFRAFEECPTSSLKVIIVNASDPYTSIGVADGIAFSCSNTEKPEQLLQLVINAVNRTVYDKSAICDFDQDLAKWSKQGVLLLNTSLTTQIDKPGKHHDLWKPFIMFLIDIINARYPHIVWVFLGKNASEFADMVNDDHDKLYAPHPAGALYITPSVWDCADVFNIVNQLLEKQNKSTISW